MTLVNTYVLARNGHGRPTLQHRLIDGSNVSTVCGCDTSSWSRYYTRELISQLICRTCARTLGVDVAAA